MKTWICANCGTQFPAEDEHPDACPICLDERQFVGKSGQRWTTLADMKQQGFHNAFVQHEPGLVAIHTVPEFAIGQSAWLLQTPDGNYLWDCISYIDEATVQIIQSLGGIKAIAISHPHYYSSMTEWAERFDVPIFLHEADREWVMKDSPRIQFWSGREYALSESVKLVRVGGHFPGSTVLHWRDGAEGRGVLLTGDTAEGLKLGLAGPE